MILVKAKIRDEISEWTEEFEVNSLETAEEEIKEIVQMFNNTLRPDELPREFIEIVEEKEIDYSKMEDKELFDEFWKLYQKQKMVLSSNKNKLDQVWGDQSQGWARYIEKQKTFSNLLNGVSTIGYKLKVKELEDVLEECVKRGWKSIKWKLKKFYG